MFAGVTLVIRRSEWSFGQKLGMYSQFHDINTTMWEFQVGCA